MAKSLSKEDRKYLLSLKQEELGIKLITHLFGKTATKKDGKMMIQQPRFDTKSKLNLSKGEYINEEAVETTVGSFLFNKIMVEGMIEHIIPGGYYNEVIDKKGFKKFMKYISNGLMMEKLEIEPNLIKWLKQYEFYGMKCSTIFSPSYTQNLLKKDISVAKEKEKLLKDNPNPSVAEMSQIEDKLVESAYKKLKGDPGMSLFDSGARGSFENDYKNMNLALGAVAIPGKDGEFDFVKSNYIDGLQKSDLVAAGNVVVNSSYPKAIGTQDAGYLTKKFFAAYQSIQRDTEGTDCGTKLGLDVLFTKGNIESFHFQYAIMGSKLELITPDNESKFINKKIRVRSPMFCPNDKICSICAGKRYGIMGIDNMGLTAGRITNTLLNASMKNFHASKVKLDKVNIDDLLI